jgi:hypothetical protein
MLQESKDLLRLRNADSSQISALAGSAEPDIRDLTIACIGECNYQYTGARDGKTLHKFLTTGLLKKAGIKAPGGFFSGYEKYIRSVTPESENCGMPLSVPLSTEVDNPGSTPRLTDG